MSIYGVILVHIFPHLDWIIPNTDTFNTVQSSRKQLFWAKEKEIDRKWENTFLRTPLLGSLLVILLKDRVSHALSRTLPILQYLITYIWLFLCRYECNRKVNPHPFAFKPDVQDGVAKIPTNNKNRISACCVILLKLLQPVWMSI